jgi:hypothetical protein
MRPGASLYGAATMILAISLLLIALLAREVGGILPFILLGYGVAAEMFGKGYLAAGFPWLYIAALMLLLRYAIHRRRSDLVLFGIALVILTAINAVMGNRNAILYQGMATLIFWHLGVTRVRVVRALPLAIVAFMSLNMLGFLRGAEFESIGDVFASSAARLDRADDAGQLHEGLFYTMTTGEFVVPFETLPMVMHAADPPIWYGGTFLRAFTYFVPSVLWPERPLSLGAWYMDAFYGGGFLPNEGRGFFFLTEGYLNFGPAGVLLVMALWGLGLGALAARIALGSLEPLAALVIALALAYVYRAISGEFSTMLVGLPQQSLLPLVLVFPYLARLAPTPRSSTHVTRSTGHPSD